MNKTRLVFSTDKKSCRISFSNGKESDFFEAMDDLFLALKDMVKKGKITKEDSVDLWGQTLDGEIEFSSKVVTAVALMIPKDKEDKGDGKEKSPGFSEELVKVYKKATQNMELPGFYPCIFCEIKDHYHLFFKEYMSPVIRSKSEARTYLEFDFFENRVTVEEKVILDLQIDQAQIPEFISQN
jgi:hypothetical protein